MMRKRIFTYSRLAVAYLFLLPMAFLTSDASAKTVVVAKWGQFERTFTSSLLYSNALQDAWLRVVFTSPLGETNVVDGFWDGGQTWRALFTQSQHVYDLTIDPRHPDTLYITGFDAAAYRSTDRGSHWERIKGYDFKWGHRVILDPNDPTQIYITTFGGGVWHGPAAGAATPPEADQTRVPIAVPGQDSIRGLKEPGS